MITSKITSSGSTEELKNVVSQAGNSIVDITDSIIFFADNSTTGCYHILNSLKNKVVGYKKIKTYLNKNKDKFLEDDYQVTVELFESFPDIFDDDLFSKKMKSQSKLDLLCRGRSDIFFKELEKIISVSVPTDENFINTARYNKKSLELLLIYHKNKLKVNIAAQIVADERVPIESVKCIIDKLDRNKTLSETDLFEDSDEIVNSFISRFGSLRISEASNDLLARIKKSSRFEKTLDTIAEKDLSVIFEELRELNLIDRDSEDLISIFCDKKAAGCLRVVLMECGTKVSHENVLKCLNDSYLLQLIVSKRAVKEPEKLLNENLGKDFNFVRSIYREINSVDLTNKSNIVAMCIAENIGSGEKFCKLDKDILPEEICEKADEIFDALEDCVNISLPQEMNLAMYLATLKHYRKYIYSYDIESIFRKEDLFGAIKDDSKMLLDILHFEQEYFEQDSD